MAASRHVSQAAAQKDSESAPQPRRGRLFKQRITVPCRIERLQPRVAAIDDDVRRTRAGRPAGKVMAHASIALCRLFADGRTTYFVRAHDSRIVSRPEATARRERLLHLTSSVQKKKTRRIITRRASILRFVQCGKRPATNKLNPLSSSAARSEPRRSRSTCRPCPWDRATPSSVSRRREPAADHRRPSLHLPVSSSS